MIWKQPLTLEGLNNTSTNTLVEHLGIQWVEIGEEYLKATMPVDKRTHQPFGLLHGGASAALAETMGSVAGMLCLADISKESVVGLEINANHLKGVRSGLVTGTVRPIRVGRNVHVWSIEIHNEENKLICVSRLTLSVIKMERS
ncbi:MAG: 1,4-dihydroxy-2-naphthoyl-CoA hydrolase [Polaribacter sp.]|jgi:1,4-dihydroxy-2-naphthoyl-CoA hydrolase